VLNLQISQLCAISHNRNGDKSKKKIASSENETVLQDKDLDRLRFIDSWESLIHASSKFRNTW